MRAITFSTFGGPEVLEVSDVEVPSPAPGQIRVAVRASGVNGYDWKLRRGLMGGDLPKRVGLEYAGVVDAVGFNCAGVAVGDEVYGFGVGGTAAEFTLSNRYARIPAGLSFEVAAGLPVAVETAFRVVDLLGATADSTLLVDGASGVVGATAVQVAVSRGARVIGTASAANQAFVASLGAEPLLYGDGLVDRVRALGVSGIDGVLDAGGGDLGALVELAGGPSHVVTIVNFAGAGAAGVTFSATTSAYYALNEVATLLAEGAFVVPELARSFPLAEAGAAQELAETGHLRGKIVLTV